MSEEIKPCPFCGGDAELLTWFEETEARHIQCTDCKCMTGIPHFERSFAYDQWNTRTTPPIDNAERDEALEDIWEYHYGRMTAEKYLYLHRKTFQAALQQPQLNELREKVDEELREYFLGEPKLTDYNKALDDVLALIGGKP